MGRHITNDISILLKINLEDAETIKKNLNQTETTFVKKEHKTNDFNSSDLSNEVIHARVDEIIKLNLAEE